MASQESSVGIHRLGHHGILSYLKENEAQTLLSQCKERVFEPGASLFRQHARHAGTYILKSGLVRTFYCSSEGKEITLAFWSHGDMVGGPDVFGNAPHMWSANAVERSVVLEVQGRDLRSLASRVPAIALAVIDALTFKLHWLSSVLQMLGTESVNNRLATLILRLSEIYGERTEQGIVIRYPFSQGDLANMVGASRQWVNVALCRMRREGMVRMHNRHLVILDREKLRHVV